MLRFLTFLVPQVSFLGLLNNEHLFMEANIIVKVAGHAGKLVFGLLGQKIPAVLMVGRAQ
jgi:hypothetical protein